MNYEQAIAYIQSTAQYGAKLGLEKVARLCELLGNPQDVPRVIHVAGTNGKGSTTAMIACALQAAGYRTGRYTSPYVPDLRDAMHIDGERIGAEELAEVTAEVRVQALTMLDNIGHPTQFEIETAIAFQWFARRGCDFVVLETGLGGRLDATNVVHRPLVTVITSISYDHMAWLGDTLAQIAAEKCGILKKDAPVVCYPLQPEEAMRVIRSGAAEMGNPLIVPDLGALEAGEPTLNGCRLTYRGLVVHVPLPGKHQIFNAITALETLFTLRDRCGVALPSEVIAAGISKTTMPLRQEVLSRRPLILLDGAHNLDGARTLAETMRTMFAGMRVVAIMGMLADKQYEPSIGEIAALSDHFIAVEPHSERALSAELAAQAARAHCADVFAETNYDAALSHALALAGSDGAVVVCGSLYLAAPMRSVILDRLGHQPS